MFSLNVRFVSLSLLFSFDEKPRLLYKGQMTIEVPHTRLSELL